MKFKNGEERDPEWVIRHIKGSREVDEVNRQDALRYTPEELAAFRAKADEEYRLYRAKIEAEYKAAVAAGLWPPKE